ncbi:MAG: hypothetical protein RL536_338 [Candidatus Parcubacteria bacterium]
MTVATWLPRHVHVRYQRCPVSEHYSPTHFIIGSIQITPTLDDGEPYIGEPILPPNLPIQQDIIEAFGMIFLDSIIIEHKYVDSEIPVDADGIPLAYQDLRSMFVTPTNIPPVPPHRPHDMAINLDPTKPLPPKSKYYSLSPENERVVDEYVELALKRGWIEPSNSPVAAGMFIVQQPNGKRRPCVDFRAINSITIGDAYPIPNINDLLFDIAHSCLYTQLDMPDAYHLVRIRAGDEWKTAFKTRKGQYQYRVMCFGLTNSPPVFERFVEMVLKEFIHKDVMVYLDNILIFTKSDTPTVTPELMKKHFETVRAVMEQLKKNDLYLRPNKCSFAVKKIDVLGYLVDWHGIHMNPEKQKAVLEWQPPTSVKGMQQFLGFANFYRRFIKDYSKIAKPLTTLTRKTVPYVWTKEADEAFQTLKEKFVNPPVMRFFDPKLETFLETDASDYALGGIVSQKDPTTGLTHPVSFHSRSLLDAECNYDTHDKELLAIVDSLKFNRPMLLSVPSFTILCDHMNLAYFTKKNNLSQRQFRWAVFLADYRFTLIHRAGKLNGNADALSRRTEFQKEGNPKANEKILFKKMKNTPCQLAFNAPELEGTIPGDFPDLPIIVSQIQLDDDSPVESNLTQTLGGGDKAMHPPVRYTLNKDYDHIGISGISLEDKEKIFQRYHDHPTAGHQGFGKTLELVRRHHSWPKIRDDLHRYIMNCTTCIRSKSKRHKPYGLLMPLAVPITPFDAVSMDFITDLPPSHGFDTILVFKCRLTKLVHLAATHKDVDTEELVRLFIRNVYRLHGIPRSLVSDRGSLFTSTLWKGITKQLGITSSLSSAFHPQSDGSTEVYNQMIEQYLRVYGNYDQDDWFKWLDLAEFTYNNSINSTTRMTPFMALQGFNPKAMPVPGIENTPSKAEQWSVNCHERFEQLRENLKSAQDDYKRFADRRRSKGPDFKVGDKVFLSSKNIKTLRPKKKLTPKYFGPFKIIQKINDVAFRLDLPPTWKIHNVFHISLLEPSPVDPFPEQVSIPPPPEEIEGQLEYEIEKILSHRQFHGRTQYLIRWRGYGAEDDTWEPADVVAENAQETIDEYLTRSKPVKPRPSRRGRPKKKAM